MESGKALSYLVLCFEKQNALTGLHNIPGTNGPETLSGRKELNILFLNLSTLNDSF